MRNFILWSLTFLLAFEPALMAAGSARQNADIKAFIEMSEMSQRSVSLKELYAKFSQYLPQAQRDELKDFIQQYGDMKLPKMDVSKIKVSGSTEEAYKLQVVSKGQAGTIEIFNDSKQFARINGQAVQSSDMNSVATLMRKLGLPAREVASTFQIDDDGSFNAKDISRLSKSDQALYFNQAREMMAAVEAVQVVDLKNKRPTATLRSYPQFEVVARWIRGEEAFALSLGDRCLAAGHITKVGHDENKRLSCGATRDGVLEVLRGTCPDKKDFACNATMFGLRQGNTPICVKAGPETTKNCIRVANESGNIMPNLSDSGNAEKLHEHLNQLKVQRQAVRELCASHRARPPNAAVQRLIDDQVETCTNYEARADEMDKWNCDTGPQSFKTQYADICKKKQTDRQDNTAAPPAGSGGADVGSPAPGATAPVAATPPVTSPGQASPSPGRPPGDLKCAEILSQNKKYSLTAGCSGGSYQKASEDPDRPKSPTCIDEKGEKLELSKYLGTIYWCHCTKDGKTIPTPTQNSCSEKAEKPVVKEGDDKGFWKKNSKWLIPLGFGVAGLLLFHWLAKQNVKEQFKYLEPDPPAKPPVAPAAPVPRGTN